jgi:prevent-host-death family protein
MRYTSSYARTHFCQLLHQAGAGEEVIVTRRTKPVVRILTLSPSQIESDEVSATSTYALDQDNLKRPDSRL